MEKNAVYLGMLVKYQLGDILTRTYPRTNGEIDFDKRVWVKSREVMRAPDLQDWNNTEISGMVVGLRTLSNGEVTYTDKTLGGPVSYQRKESFTAILISTGLRSGHIRVRPEDCSPHINSSILDANGLRKALTWLEKQGGFRPGWYSELTSDILTALGLAGEN